MRMMKKIKINSFLILALMFILSSCATTPPVKVLEERDPVVKKIEEKDSLRIIKNSANKDTSNKKTIKQSK